MQTQNIPLKTKITCAAGLLCLTMLLSMSDLSSKPLEGHEGFVAVTARQMIQNGNYVLPIYNTQPRLQKTPLNYWLTATCAKITNSGVVNEFSTRLPSALAGCLLVIAMLFILDQTTGFRVAALSSGLWICSLAFVRYSTSGKSEMTLTAFTAIAMICLFTALNSDRRNRQIVYALAFWICFAIANLAKGPAPLPLVIAPAIIYLILFKLYKKIPMLLPIVGPLVFLAIVLPWPILVIKQLTTAASAADTGAMSFWKTEFIDRFLGSHDAGHKPPYYYLPVMFQMLVPWCFFVPVALISPFYKIWQQQKKQLMFFWIWLTADMVFMSISGGKRMHYILPAIPALCILAGFMLNDMTFINKAFTKKFAKKVLTIHMYIFAVGIIASAAWAAGKYRPMLPQICLIGVAALVVVPASCLFFFKGKKAVGLSIIFIGFAVCTALVNCLFINPSSPLKFPKQFARSLSQEFPENTKLIAYKDVSSRVVYYFGREIPIAGSIDDAFTAYENGNPILAVTPWLQEMQKDSRFKIYQKFDKADLYKDEPSQAVVFKKPQ